MKKRSRSGRNQGTYPYQASLLNNLAVLRQQLGEYEEAAHAFEEGLLCAKQSGYRRMEALISLGLGDLYAEIEDFEMAEQNYRQAGDLIDQLGEPFLRDYLSLVRANLALLGQDAQQARTLIERAARMIQNSQSNYDYLSLIHI